MEVYEPFREVDFRDGPADIPAYLADVMAGLATHTMTKDEAIALAEQQMMHRYVKSAYDGVLREHFRGGR
jgi:hypothetical protein